MTKESPETAPMVIVDNVSLSFKEIRALRETSFDVRGGEIFGLIGSDGAGKSTLLRLMAGLLKPQTGHISILSMNTVQNARAIKPLVGYMPQRFGLYPDLTVEENIDFFMDVFSLPRGERKKRKEKYLRFSKMLPFLDRAAGDLSGGMKQKLGLACVLVHEPKVLILDEPTNGVDPVSRMEFWNILESMKKEGMTMVVSTAYLDEGERCDRLALMHAGAVLTIEGPIVLKSNFSTLEAAVIERLKKADKELARDAFGI